jgi:hypothetical protein
VAGGIPLDVASLVVWLVPGFALTVPGLIIILVVAAQIVGGGAFVPLARRILRGLGTPQATTART